MRIAIIGSGISGLVCARLLSQMHEIVLLEADDRPGGHANTITVDTEGKSYDIDAGFIVYNDRTYPKFTRILSDLNVATSPTSMSFSVRCERTELEYNGTSFNGLFAQRSNLFRGSFLRMLRDIIRFNRQGPQDLATVAEDQTVGEYLAEKRYSSQFAQNYLLPMGAAIWSCPCDDFAKFPIRFSLEFYVNHGLLSLRDRPIWRVIDGGSKQYVSKLANPFIDRIRLNCPVKSVRRTESGVLVSHAGGTECYDEVVFACHSDQALRILADPDQLETKLLSAFPYSKNWAVMHTDESLLPRRRRAWASWNYHIAQSESSRPTLTYNMNLLQHIQASKTFLLTLNEDSSIDPSKILKRFQYSHPIFTTQRSSIQKRHAEVIRHRRTSFCGAYWRNGFHEDGVVSALAVCRRFGIPDWNCKTNRSDRQFTNRIELTAIDRPSRHGVHG